MIIKDIVREVFSIELKEISNLLTVNFDNAIYVILKCKGEFIITGMGKSEIIAN